MTVCWPTVCPEGRVAVKHSFGHGRPLEVQEKVVARWHEYDPRIRGVAAGDRS